MLKNKILKKIIYINYYKLINNIYKKVKKNNIIINKHIYTNTKWGNPKQSDYPYFNIDNNSGGIILFNKYKNIIILNNAIINANKSGYFGHDKQYNIGYNNDKYEGYHNYGNKKLTNIYHGSGGWFNRGGGIIYIICDILLNNGKIICNGDILSSGGSILICGKYIVNNGKIESVGFDKFGKIDKYKYSGFIGIYCNLFFDNGLVNILNKKFYLNKYDIYNNISKKKNDKKNNNNHINIINKTYKKNTFIIHKKK